MHVRTTAVAVLAVGLLLTGCSSNDDKPEPATPNHTSAAPTKPTLSKAETARRCITALVDQVTEDQSGEVGAVRPKACAQLGDSEYAEAILKATQRVNQAAQDDLQDRIDEATGGSTG
ncbi:hypothetical protein [Streptomyces sp. RTd22]|uniref:hypothetical protein n=1 Tax=Streptomyces sp. RTd22 TaxID=1841249 RepID=UPI0007C5C9BA|nr:hypothetical protein [Streptomyces sp. RTd22]